MRVLSYQVPFERLTKLSRSASRKAYPGVRRLTLLVLGLFLAAVAILVAFAGKLSPWLEDAGIPYGVELLFLATFLVFFVSLRLLRRYQIGQAKSRVNFNQVVRMTQDDGGLRFDTNEAEFYFRWHGLSQLLLEPDGVVVSHGNLFFLIPNTAFTSAEDRLAFIREVYGRLNETARAISEKHVRATLRVGGRAAALGDPAGKRR